MYHLLNLYKTRKSLTLMIFSKEKIYLKKENLTIYKLKIIPGVYNLYFEIKLPNWFSVWFQFLGFRDIWYVRQFIKFSLILVSFFSVWFAIPGKCAQTYTIWYRNSFFKYYFKFGICAFKALLGIYIVYTIKKTKILITKNHFGLVHFEYLYSFWFRFGLVHFVPCWFGSIIQIPSKYL